MQHERHEVFQLAADLRRFSQGLGGPHDRAAEMLLELYEEILRRGKLAEECHQMYLLKARENDRYRRKLNLQHQPLLRNTAAADLDMLIQLHNAARQKTSWPWKKPPMLIKDETLMIYAQSHANFMAEKDSLEHSDIQKVRALGFTKVGENIAWGQQTPERVMQSWLWSAGHRRNIMSAGFNRIGCGASKGPDDRLYWCVCFGNV